jgi:hypothetical protein
MVCEHILGWDPWSCVDGSISTCCPGVILRAPLFAPHRNSQVWMGSTIISLYVQKSCFGQVVL